MYFYISIPFPTGSYLDDEGLAHAAISVELYLPWNDTWIDLDFLPAMTHNGTVFHMTDTHIMSLAVAGFSNRLSLLGGMIMDWNTDIELITDRVCKLTFNFGKHSYFWDACVHLVMGKCGGPQKRLITGACDGAIPNLFLKRFLALK